MKSLIYFFRRYKLATTLNVLGLGIALAAFYLFMTQVEYNDNYNHGIRDYERTYRLELINGASEWSDVHCQPFYFAIKDLPHVEDAQMLSHFPYEVKVEYNDHEYPTIKYEATLPGIEFFSDKLVDGNLKDWHSDNTVLINKSLARTIFGEESAVGKTLISKQANDKYTIVGVYEDFPHNCSIENGIYGYIGDWGINNFSEWSFIIYVRLDDAANKEEVEKSILMKFMTSFSQYTDIEKFEKEGNVKVRLNPVSDTHFSGVNPDDNGNRNLLLTLQIASIFVLIVAMLNLTNFTLAETPMRIRGINTRKVMGASATSLRLGMIMENIMLSIAGLVVALIFILLFQQSTLCMTLVSGSVAIADHLWLVGCMALAALLIGICSALYPAWYSTSFTPALVLKGAFGLSPQGRHLRIAMVFVQFVVAFVLTIYVCLMSSQSHYIFNCDYGYNKQEVLFSSVLSYEGMNKQPYIKAELEKLPFVESVAFGSDALGDSDVYMSWGRGEDNGEHHVQFYVLPVDPNYLKTMQINIIEGRDFEEHDTETGAFILNKCMMEQYDWLKVGEPIGDWDASAYNIVGVCDNIKITSMRNDNASIAAGFIVMGPDMAGWGNRNTRVLVRIASGYDKLQAKQQIEEVMEELDSTLSYTFSFLDDRLQKTYAEEFRFINQVKAFALICILITLAGVFCLTMFETEYRRKEIAIRKVMGSSVNEVTILFASRYALPLVIAFVLAAPLGYMLGKQWLQNFAEQTPIHWWLFPLSFLTVSIIVILTIVAQSWRVARMNPVESIKTE